jgi:hypothetical protein
MVLETTILATEYSTATLLETQLAFGKFIENVALITQKNNSELIKNINTNEYKDGMALKEIVDDLLKIYTGAKDVLSFAKAKMYYADAEKYRIVGENNTYKYLKRQCIAKFEKIKNPELIQKFKEEMGSYLPKKYLK